jgi:hypothetical protein
MRGALGPRGHAPPAISLASSSKAIVAIGPWTFVQVSRRSIRRSSSTSRLWRREPGTAPCARGRGRNGAVEFPAQAGKDTRDRHVDRRLRERDRLSGKGGDAAREAVDERAGLGGRERARFTQPRRSARSAGTSSQPSTISSARAADDSVRRAEPAAAARTWPAPGGRSPRYVPCCLTAPRRTPCRQRKRPWRIASRSTRMSLK